MAAGFPKLLLMTRIDAAGILALIDLVLVGGLYAYRRRVY